MPPNDPKEDDLQAHLPAKKERRRRPANDIGSQTTQEISPMYSPLVLQILFGVQRVGCVGIAIWDYIHTRDLSRFMMLLIAGQLDLAKAKEIATKVITDLVIKLINKEI